MSPGTASLRPSGVQSALILPSSILNLGSLTFETGLISYKSEISHTVR